MKLPAALLIKPVIGFSANNSSTEDSIASESLISKDYLLIGMQSSDLFNTNLSKHTESV